MALSLASGRTVLLFEIPHISMSLDSLIPLTRVQTLAAIDAIISEEDHHGELTQGAVVAGHSFGSIIATWLVMHRPDLVSQIVLIDPVCLLLFLPDVCFNFLYRSPQSLMELLIAVFASGEMTVSNTLRRHFWWYEVRRRTTAIIGSSIVTVHVMVV